MSTDFSSFPKTASNGALSQPVLKECVYISLSLLPSGCPGISRGLAPVPPHLWKWIRRISGGEPLQPGLVKGHLLLRTQTARPRGLHEHLSRQPGRGSTSSAPGSLSCLSRAHVRLGGMEHPQTEPACKAGISCWAPTDLLRGQGDTRSCM